MQIKCPSKMKLQHKQKKKGGGILVKWLRCFPRTGRTGTIHESLLGDLRPLILSWIKAPHTVVTVGKIGEGVAINAAWAAGENAESTVILLIINNIFHGSLSQILKKSN